MNNQSILGKLVGREVKGLATDIVAKLEELSDGNFFIEDDIKFMYEWPCPECGADTNGNERDIDGNTEYYCKECGWTDSKEAESQMKEVLEWWFVSDWFADKLEAKGEPVYRGFHLAIWGRQTSGQAILLDGVIESIAKDMEILQGQRNEWKD